LFLFAFNVYLPFNNESVNAIIPPPRTANYTVYVSGLPSQSRSPISASGGDYKSSSWNSSSQQLTVTYSNFVVYPSFTLTAVAPSGYIFSQWVTGGTISPSGVVSVNYGGSKTFTITPNAGYKIKDVKVDGVSVGAVSTYTFTNVTANHTISATFVPNTYTVTFNSQGGSSVSSQVVSYGGKVTQPSDPIRTGYTFGGWYKESGCINAWNFSTDTVTSNITLYAKWIINTYTITASAGTGGTISPSGAVSVNYGGSKTFTITPNAGYKIKDVKVDGVSVGAVNTYTFTNVVAPHTIVATFSCDGYFQIDLSQFTPTSLQNFNKITQMVICL